MLVEFVSVVEAVRCAVDIQRGMHERNSDVPAEKRIQFRIGINVGDIIIDGDDIYGDGVNVAARLEGLADPGGIMVSRVVHDQVQDKLGFEFDDMGEQAVKNIARPVGVHRIHLTEQLPRSVAPAAGKTERVASEQPSIAVLPFLNMSGDPEQEYFASAAAASAAFTRPVEWTGRRPRLRVEWRPQSLSAAGASAAFPACPLARVLGLSA